jgi:hypothetical protein
VSNLEVLILCELGMASEMKGVVKDSRPANVLAVKHDICSFVGWGKRRSHSLMLCVALGDSYSELVRVRNDGGERLEKEIFLQATCKSHRCELVPSEAV